ncbi:ATP-binding protein [Streptomyces sp. NPDC019890]|uniref:ATP-binding protein n=1 Tax=Streptomyces sp. NPDC019890 TaxID=3365064 RepID=UPI00384AEE0B
MTHIPGQSLFHSFRVSPEDPATVPKARRLLLAVVRDWNLPLADETQDDLGLLSSEVIANAVSHTTGPCSVTVRWTGVRLRVEVTDTVAGLPTPRRHELYAESGRGLVLVASLAASWGSTRTATGKVVWFEVAPAPPTADLDRLAS